MTEHILHRQIEILDNKDSVTKERLWKSNTFKMAALQYSGQWQALKDTCTMSSKQLTSVQDEVNQYICASPTKEEAVEIVQQLASDILGSKPSEKLASDKPANN